MPQFGWDSGDAARDRRDSTVDRDPAQRSPPPLDRKASPEGRAEHQKQASQFSQSDQSELVIDPALRSNTPRLSAVDDKKREGRESPGHVSMPLRAVEPSSFMSSSHRRQHFDDSHRLPSPPASIGPVAHSHSPSPSVASADRSSISTPPIRRSPPQTSMPPPPHLFQSSQYHHDPSMIQSSRHHPEHFARADNINHGQAYLYAPPPPPFDHRYDQPHPVNHSPYHHNPNSIPTHFSVPPPMAHHPPSYGHPYPQPGPQPPVQIMHTDDAATKLSDRVRRRCFNCCTTDTSTWRRSNLSPGKVLCNKCGLFERTHSRPRPEQFPHKRGPLATSTLQRGRTPPASAVGGNPNNQQQQHFTQPPPPPPGHLGPPGHMPPNHLPPIAPPYGQYTHPSIPPLNSSHPDGRRDSTGGSNSGSNSSSNNNSGSGNNNGSSSNGNGGSLPGLQSWHGNNSASNGGDSGQGSPHLGGSAPHSRRQSESHASGGGGHARLPTPPPSSLSRSVNSSGDSAREAPSSNARDGPA